MPRIAFVRDVIALAPTLWTIFEVLMRSSLRAVAGMGRRPGAQIRIGVDARAFFEPLTGIGWYLYHLLEELSRREGVQLVVFGVPFVTVDGPRLHVELPDGLEVITFNFGGKPLSRFSRYVANAAYPLLVLLQRCDLFFAPNYFLPRGLSSVAKRRVVTIHDLTFQRFPELLQAETLTNLRDEMLREICGADAIICVSEATRRDLLEFYEVDPRRAITIHSGLPSITELSEPLESLPQRYILFVSTIEPRKGLINLIGAFERLKLAGEFEGDLVIVGKVGWKSEETMRRARTSRWAAQIRHLDYLTRAQLSTVYQRAEIFVLPSLYEGFGFPLLEAMSHGVPTVAASSSSLPEIGGDAALYFEPGNEVELQQKIRQLVDDKALTRTLVERGHVQVRKFRWDQCADQTLEVFRRVSGKA